MNIERDFTRIIYKALVEIDYVGSEDNNRLRGAIDDFANDFPKEKKLFMRNADDQFLRICSNSAIQDEQQRELIKAEASQYIQDEYQLAPDYADSLAEDCVDAFARHLQKTKGLDIGTPIPPKATESAVDSEDASHDTPDEWTIITKGRSNKKILLGICAIVLVFVAVFAVIYGITSSKSQNSANNKMNASTAQSTISEENGNEADDYQLCNYDGIEFEIPFEWNEHPDADKPWEIPYVWNISDENASCYYPDEDMPNYTLEVGTLEGVDNPEEERDYEVDFINECFAEDDDVDGTITEDTRLIDGRQCYSYQIENSYWVHYRLLIPTGNNLDLVYLEISYDCDDYSDESKQMLEQILETITIVEP